MGRDLDDVVRSVNVHMPSPTAWFTVSQLEEWAKKHDVTFEGHTRSQLDEGWATVAVILPYEHRNLVIHVPELGEKVEGPRHYFTRFMKGYGFADAYKGSCQAKAGERFHVMLYGPGED